MPWKLWRSLTPLGKTIAVGVAGAALYFIVAYFAT